MTLGLGQNILPFLSLKDLKKFGCVHKTISVRKYLATRGKCLLCEDRMLFEISDILGDVTERMISIYIDDPFKVVWSSTLMAFRMLPIKYNKIMGKEEGNHCGG